jgi:hypothetical protein
MMRTRNVLAALAFALAAQGGEQVAGYLGSGHHYTASAAPLP